jgi:hypothetical protein
MSACSSGWGIQTAIKWKLHGIDSQNTKRFEDWRQKEKEKMKVAVWSGNRNPSDGWEQQETRDDPTRRTSWKNIFQEERSLFLRCVFLDAIFLIIEKWAELKSDPPFSLLAVLNQTNGGTAWRMPSSDQIMNLTDVRICVSVEVCCRNMFCVDICRIESYVGSRLNDESWNHKLISLAKASWRHCNRNGKNPQLFCSIFVPPNRKSASAWPFRNFTSRSIRLCSTARHRNVV